MSRSDLKNTLIWPESPAITKPDLPYCLPPWFKSGLPNEKAMTELMAKDYFLGSDIWIFLKSPVDSKSKIWPISVQIMNLPSASQVWAIQFVEMAG